MSITLITTTRNRSLCFSLLEKWIARQSIPWDQWIVVNDGQQPYNYTMGQEVVNRDPSNDNGRPSILQNWCAALPLVRGEKVFAVEDDDYYHPSYLKTLSSELDEVDLAGVDMDVYYKLPFRKFQRMYNGTHASLASTCWRSVLNPEVARLAGALRTVFLDCHIWVEAGTVWPASKRLLDQPLKNGEMLHVGMKCMPGEEGLGIGHTAPHEGTTDYGWQTLRKWVGADASMIYRKVWEEQRAVKRP